MLVIHERQRGELDVRFSGKRMMLWAFIKTHCKVQFNPGDSPHII